MKNTPQLDEHITIRKTANGTRRSVARVHTSVSLTAGLMKWAQQEAFNRGIAFTAYLEQVLRAERDRQLNPPPVVFVTSDPSTGQIVGIPLKRQESLMQVASSPASPDTANA